MERPWVSSVIPGWLFRNYLPTVSEWKTALQLNSCGKKISVFVENFPLKREKSISDILSQIRQNEFSRLLLIT